MFANNWMDKICGKCGCKTKYYDRVKRMVRGKGGHKYYIFVDRRLCHDCGEIHRDLPDIVLPYKQYEAEIIRGVVEGLIDENTYGFEDYPCNTTMKRWLKNFSQNMHGVLWKGDV